MTHTSIKGTSIRRPAQLSSSSDLEYVSPEAFIADISDDQIRSDVRVLHDLIREVAPELEPQTKFKGTISYGKCNVHYKTSGRQREWCKLGISYGKQITLHCFGIVNGKHVLEQFEGAIPKAKLGLTSLRFQRLADLNLKTLEEIIRCTATATVI